MKRLSIILSLLVMLCVSCNQEIQRPSSFNYNQGMESYNKEDYVQAYKYLSWEVKDNDENGYAYMYLADVCVKAERYEEALGHIDKAIYRLPMRDKEYYSTAYIVKGDIYTNTEDYDMAETAYANAVRIYDSDYNLEKLADFYFWTNNLDKSDKIYQRMIDNNHLSLMGYMGRGRNAKCQKRYDEAIKYFSKAIKISPNYGTAYGFRAECYRCLSKKDTDRAMNDILTGLKIDSNEKVFSELIIQSHLSFKKVSQILKKKIEEQKDEPLWVFCIGIINEDNNHYEKAIAYYTAAYAMDENSSIAERLSFCYGEIGDTINANFYKDKMKE